MINLIGIAIIPLLCLRWLLRGDQQNPSMEGYE